MKTLIRGGLLLSATLGIASVKAQSVDDIVSKHIDALGGKAVLAAVKSVYVESSMEVMGNEAPTTTYILMGKGYKSETDFNVTKIVQVVTDQGGWMVNPMTGSTGAQPLPKEQLKNAQLNLTPGGPLMDYAKKGLKAELIGKDSANYKIKVTGPDGVDVTYFIDMKSYLINKTVNKMNMGGQDMEQSIIFSDYRKTDAGYMMPYSQQLVLPQMTLSIVNKKIEINKDIDPKIFEMPKS